MFDQNIQKMANALQAKDISSEELTNYYLNRIRAHDKSINSYITVCEESARSQAKAIDNARAKGEPLPPLAGIPYAHKDIFCTSEIKTSCGSKMLDNFVAPYDAFVTQQFNQQKLVMLGKANMDEFAMGSANESSYYGPVKNPWDVNAVPGGSSGGSAAIVAANLAAFATGTDTGGSIRQPAAFTGITGIKPTYGRVSRFGMVAFASSLDQGGPMGRTSEDCASILSVMAGHDANDSTSLNEPVPNYLSELNKAISGKKIGLAKEYFEQLSPEAKALCDNTVAQLTKLGVEFIEISLPNLKYCTPTYYVIAPAECSANLARYDGVRYGYRCDNPSDLNDLYCRTRQEGFGVEVKRRVMIGTYALSSGYYDAYYLKAQKVRALIANDFKKAFASVDAIFTPTTPTPAFNLGTKQTPIEEYMNDIYTISVNLAGLPALSMPIGFINNRPFGGQLIGDYLDEALLLNLAHQYQQHTTWHLKTPAHLS